MLHPKLIVVLLLAALAGPLRAAQLPELYGAQVPAAGNDQRAQTKAIQDAMRAVLIKVTGNPDIESLTVADDLIRRARDLMLQYRYTVPEEPREDLPLLLWVQFDPELVDATLQRSGVPLWTGQRPPVLVWLAVRSSSGPVLVGADDATGLREQLETLAAERGIPLVLPLLDAEDQGAIQAADVAGFDSLAIYAASARYAAGTILVGVLEATGDQQWTSWWNLHLGAEVREWRAVGGFNSALASGVNGAADHLVEMLVARNADAQLEGGFQLTVTGAGDLASYAQVQSYLDGIGGVSQVQLLSVEADRLTYFISARGGASAVEQHLALGGLLTKEGNGMYRLTR